MYLYPLFTDIIVLIVRCAYLFSYGFVLPIKIRHRLTQSLNYFPSDVCACMTFCSFTSILLCLLQFNIPPKRKETWHSERNPLDGRKLQQLFQKCTVSIHFKKHVVNKRLTQNCSYTGSVNWWTLELYEKNPDLLVLSFIEIESHICIYRYMMKFLSFGR